MRTMKLLAATAAALSISVSPVLAQTAGPASKLSVSNASSVRAYTDAGDSNNLAPAVILGVLAAVAIIGGIIILADDDDEPDSP